MSAECDAGEAAANFLRAHGKALSDALYFCLVESTNGKAADEWVEISSALETVMALIAPHLEVL